MNKILDKMVKQSEKQNEDQSVSKSSDKIENLNEEPKKILLTNFYDWFEENSNQIKSISRVKQEVAQTNVKDTMIFKVPKNKNTEEKELVSFYNPVNRPILNLPPVYAKVFKNDTFEVLHTYSNDIFIKSYGVKTGLIIVYCALIDEGIIVPFKKLKIKKNVLSIELPEKLETISSEIKNKLNDSVDVESIQLLYKQSIKYKNEFSTKKSALDWFLNIQKDVIDINHLLKIDSILINII